MILICIAAETTYHDILNLVRRADTVTTYVTNGFASWQERDFLRKTNIAAFNHSHKGEFVKKVGPKNREGLISFLKAAAGPKTELMPGCFMPHHFVYASKGNRHIEIEICFTCAHLLSYGDLSYFAAANVEALAKRSGCLG